ncbi:hypothetical protein PUN28_016097 [Cardiocondyla obscurior]|uniref:Uncharacterized protein n=1 Tax=Cardiocondyla obscurior TaxID=286306 RepID=A0AAW2EVT2_9HYME
MSLLFTCPQTRRGCFEVTSPNCRRETLRGKLTCISSPFIRLCMNIPRRSREGRIKKERKKKEKEKRNYTGGNRNPISSKLFLVFRRTQDTASLGPRGEKISVPFVSGRVKTSARWAVKGP